MSHLNLPRAYEFKHLDNKIPSDSIDPVLYSGKYILGGYS